MRSTALSFAMLLAVYSTLRAADPALLQEFTITEHFGVSHAAQLIDFDLKEKTVPGKVHVLGPDGKPCLFQLLDGGTKLAVMADLPKGQSRTWKLVAGAPPKQLPALVTVTTSAIGKLPVYTVTNKLTGVKVPYGVKTPMPQFQLPGSNSFGLFVAGKWFPAPIQDVLMRDNKWAVPAVRPGLKVEASRHVKSETKVLERGPLRAIIEVTHYFETDKYESGGKLIRPAGKGYYKCTVRLDAGRPSVLLEDESDLEAFWNIDLYRAVKPNQFRYWGHYSHDARFGQDEDGMVYRGRLLNLDYDAIVPITFNRLRLQSYVTNEDGFATILPWDPWRGTGGFYWQMLNTKGTDKSNTLGIFAAKASRAIGAAVNGPGFWLRPPQKRPNPKIPAAPALCGVGVNNFRGSPDARIFPKSRFAWGLFVGTKADVKPVKELQTINHEMNIVGGINLNKVHRYIVDFPDPKGGYGGLFMDKASVDAVKKRVKDDKLGPLGKGYFGYLYQADSAARSLFDLWGEPGRELFDKQVAATLEVARDLLETLANGRGIFSFPYHYWHGGSRMAAELPMLDQLLGDTRCTPEQRKKLKAATVLFGSIISDDDFVPLIPDTGLRYGSENMLVQFAASRKSYALFLAAHPAFSERAKRIIEEAPKDLERVFDENGVVAQSPHYAGASVLPTLMLLAMVQQRGKDPFLGSARASKFGEFYMNFLTPPEVRFNSPGAYPLAPGARAPVILGDGAMDPSVLYGLHGTALRSADPKMSARLMGAWQQSNKIHASFYGTSAVRIDDTLKAEDPKLGDYNGPGYYSVLRHGWGTPNESALWMITGDRYRDHRHTDHGSIVLYALGKPLITNWSSFGSPNVGGSFMHSGVTLEKHLPEPWDKDGANMLGAGNGWNSTLLAYASYDEGAFSKARFDTMIQEPRSGSDKTPKMRKVVWTRTVVALRPKPDRPIYVIRDECDATDLKRIATVNLNAKGAIATPAGEFTPDEKRLHPRVAMLGSKDSKDLPFTGPAIALRNRVSRFSFTGQFGVDCDVFVIADGAEATLGNWGVSIQSGIIGGTPAIMRQHILRVRSSGPVITVIVPRDRADKQNATATKDGDSVAVTIGEISYRIGVDHYSVKATGKTITRKLRNQEK
jgi:hypothetical protein